jgi:hypothetical protein
MVAWSPNRSLPIVGMPPFVWIRNSWSEVSRFGATLRILVTDKSKIDVDRELDGMRRLDAAVLRGLLVPPAEPRAPGRSAFQIRSRLTGVRGAMKRLERRGYIEPGWRLDHDRGATFQLTELGKRVAPAAAFATEAEAMEYSGRVQAFYWLRGRLRTR